MRAEQVVTGLLGELKRHGDPKRGSEKKPVFWLGAGCSTFDGIPTNEELLPILYPECQTAVSQQLAFDKYCEKEEGSVVQDLDLERHLRATLRNNSPYLQLVQLLIAGFIDMVVTMNIDNLLEQALGRFHLERGRDYQLVDLKDGHEALAQTGLRIKIIKLFSDPISGYRSLTTLRMPRHDAAVERFTRDYSRLPAVVCGYSFFHVSVASSFSTQASPLYYINKSFPDAALTLGLLNRRFSMHYVVDERLGQFADFIDFLSALYGSQDDFVIKVTGVTHKEQPALGAGGKAARAER